MANCKECIHCKMDDIWGEPKCLARAIRIYSADKYADCEFFKEKKNDETRNAG